MFLGQGLTFEITAKAQQSPKLKPALKLRSHYVSQLHAGGRYRILDLFDTVQQLERKPHPAWNLI